LAAWRNLSVPEGNHAKASYIEREFSELAQSKGAIGFADVERYFRIKYKDIYAEDHTEFYLVDTAQRTRKLSTAEGMRIFKEWDRAFSRQVLDLGKFTPEKLYEELFEVAKRER
jgi:hypothetical protein